jgi:uncharacterized protein YqeY
MTIEERLLEDMKLALKAKDKIQLDTIRLLRAQIKDMYIDKKADLTENEVEKILSTAAKRRKEAIELYAKGNRDDLVAKEKAELDIILKYLPEQLDEQEIDKIVHETINTLQATSEKDIGRVMGTLMSKLKGKADGKLVQQKVREALSKLTQ